MIPQVAHTKAAWQLLLAEAEHVLCFSSPSVTGSWSRRFQAVERQSMLPIPAASLASVS